jgi:hypothetical protein
MADSEKRGAPWPSRWTLPIAWVFGLAYCVAFALAPMRTLRWLLTGPLAYVVAASAVLSALDTIIILELVRMAVPTSDRWTRATYWRVIAALWPALFALLLAAAFLMKRRLG